MLIFISGAVRSGKSSFAEKYLSTISSQKFYLATAKNNCSEMQNRISIHQNSRKQKGFTTIECSVDILKTSSMLPRSCSILLECLTTLVANEMFDNNLDVEKCTNKVLSDILNIYKNVHHLVIVSNDLYGNESFYDESVINYCKTLSNISRRLVTYADEVYEIVYGVIIKRK